MKDISASSVVYDFVYNKITTKEWKTGDKILSENALASQLKVSRVSVRKALDQLAGVGLITKKRGSGAFVTELKTSDIFDTILPIITINKEQFIDLLEFRIGFESINVEMLENTLNKNMLNKLIDVYHEMENHKNDKSEFYKLDLKFHQLIAQSTNNSIIQSISNVISESMLSQLATLYEKIGPEHGLYFHKLIIEALSNNDFQIAAMYMKKHLVDALESYKQVYEENCEF